MVEKARNDVGLMKGQYDAMAKPGLPSKSRAKLDRQEAMLEKRRGETPPPKPPIEKPQPKLSESGDVRGLNVEENRELRARLNLEGLDDYQRKSKLETFQRAKDAKLDERALEIADEARNSKRMISDEESAGIVIKSLKLEKEYEASIKTQAELIEKGNTAAAELERGRSDAIIKQLDNLTEGMRLGKREVARALASGVMKVDPADYGLARAVQEVTAKRKKPVTPEQRGRLEKVINERDNLRKQVDELEAKYDQLMAETEKKVAEKVAQIEARKSQIKKKIGEKKAKLQAEREEIKKQLRGLGYRVNELHGLTAEGSYLVGKLAVNYIREGTASLEGVVKQVMADMPGLTERDVWQALNARDPKRIQKARSETQKKIAEIKKQAELLDKIDKAEKGIFEKPAQKAPLPPEIKVLQKQLRQLRAQAYKTAKTDVQLQRAIKTLNELQDQVDNHYRNVRKQKPSDPAVVADIKSKIADLRKIMRVEDQLTDLNEQLRTGEFKVKPERKADPPELERKKIELQMARKRVRTAMQAMEPITKGRVAMEAINTLRTMKATADMSATLRQGLLLIAQKPGSLPKSFGKSFLATFSRNKAEAYDYAMRQMPEHYLREKAGLHWSELEGMPSAKEEYFAANAIEKIPGLGHIIKASNRHMTTFLNMMRAASFDFYVKKYPNATPAELKKWANFVNICSGRGNLGKGETLANALSVPFFAPKFAWSRVQYPFMGLAELRTPRIRKEIALNYVRFASMGAMAMGLVKLAGWEVGDDPRNSDWGKIKKGDTRVDIFGGVQQPMRLIVRLGVGVTDKWGWTGSGLSEREKRIDAIDLVMRSISYKFAPVVTVPSELISGKTIVGEKSTPFEAMARAFSPMIVEDIRDAWRLEGPGRAAVVGGLTFFGVGANTYEKGRKKSGGTGPKRPTRPVRP